MKRLLISFTLLSLVLASMQAQPKRIRVPQDQATVQAGIDVAVNGDTVLVAEGTYSVNLVLKKKIVLASLYILDADTSHISKTILDGGTPVNPDSGSVICISGATDSTTVVAGFTIRNGKGTRLYDGGSGKYWKGGFGIYLTQGAANIHHNLITGVTFISSDGVWGGGIAMWPNEGALSYWIIENNRIVGNSITSTATSVVSAEGGGVWLTEDGRFNRNVVANNSAVGIVYGAGGGISLGGSPGYGSTTIEMSNNIIRGNSASHWGGGIVMYIDPTLLAVPYVTLTNNIFSGNSAAQLGAAMHIQGGNYTLINNTITGNSGPQALEVQSYRGSLNMRFLNNIIWNPNSTNEILANVGSYTRTIAVSYSDVRGGYAGTGNINADPRFVGNDSWYHLSDSSYCIARGIDSVQFNSVWYYAPSKDYLGSSRPMPAGTHPDIGAIEHPSGVARELPPPLMGSKFRAFANRVEAAPNLDRTAIVDSFFTANPMTPFIEDTIVHFLYRGSATTINIAGALNGWDPAADAMNKLSTTDLWFKVRSFEKDARIEYKFVLDGSNWILDPKNSNIMPGGLGDNSIVFLPGYKAPPEINYYPDIQHGTMFDTTITSASLGNARRIQVYTPYGYNPAANDSLPVFVWHDANDWIPYGKVVNILDYLIHYKRVKPHIAVLVYWVDRNNEYVFNSTTQYSNFILNELMPYVDTKYRAHKNPAYRGMIGISYGGTITTQICNARPDVFGLAAMMSPAYQPNNYAVLNQFVSAPLKSLKIYLDWGSYEWDIAFRGKYLRDNLTSKGYSLRWNEWHEGHTYGSWRAHIDNVLEYFIPGTAVSVEREKYEIPTSFTLLQNYPNPFNPETKIGYELPVTSSVKLVIYDLLGREVAVLVNEEMHAGTYKATWDAAKMPSGVYFYRLTAGEFVETRKLVLLR